MFLSCLDSITKRLEHIRARNVLITAMLPESNIDEIQACETEFSDAIERFQVYLITLSDVFNY